MMEKKHRFRTDGTGWGKTVSIVLMAFSVLLALYLTGVMFYRTRATVDRGGYLEIYESEMFICALLLFTGLDMRFRFVRHYFPSVLAWITKLVQWVLLLLLGAIFAMIFSHSLEGPDVQTEYVIVLGMALENGKPNSDLLGRVDAAYEYAQRHPDAKLILTGGNKTEISDSEASVMRDLLLKKGVPESRMILDDKASSTIQNFENVAQLIDVKRPVALVTSDYHMLRAVSLARSMGYRQVVDVPARSDFLLWPANVMWEIVCIYDNVRLGRAFPIAL